MSTEKSKTNLTAAIRAFIKAANSTTTSSNNNNIIINLVTLEGLINAIEETRNSPVGGSRFVVSVKSLPPFVNIDGLDEGVKLEDLGKKGICPNAYCGIWLMVWLGLKADSENIDGFEQPEPVIGPDEVESLSQWILKSISRDHGHTHAQKGMFNGRDRNHVTTHQQRIVELEQLVAASHAVSNLVGRILRPTNWKPNWKRYLTLKGSVSSFTGRVISIWSRAKSIETIGQEQERELVPGIERLLKAASENLSSMAVRLAIVSSWEARDLMKILKTIPRIQRYEAIRKLYGWSTFPKGSQDDLLATLTQSARPTPVDDFSPPLVRDLAIDLSSFSLKKASEVAIPYDHELLSLMHNRDAKACLERMERWTASENTTTAQDKLHRLKWARETGDREQVKEALKFFQNEAIKCSDRNRRATLVVAFLGAAASSGDFEMLTDAVRWILQRYLRDQATRQNILLNLDDDVIQMLSGLPLGTCFGATTSNPKISEDRIKSADSILVLFIDFCRKSISQPDFSTNEYYDLESLLETVLERRIGVLPHLQRTEKEFSRLANLLLGRSFINILLEFERLRVLEYPDKPFEFRKFPHYQTSIPRIVWPGSSCCPLVIGWADQWLKERDDLWKQARFNCHPATAELPSGLPKGLPCQQLIEGLDMSGPSSRRSYDLDSAPFVKQRVEEVLFANPAHIGCTLKESQLSGVILFKMIDDCEAILTAYVTKCRDSEIGKDRFLKVIHHYHEMIAVTAKDSSLRRLNEKILRAAMLKMFLSAPFKVQKSPTVLEKVVCPILPELPAASDHEPFELDILAKLPPTETEDLKNTIFFRRFNGGIYNSQSMSSILFPTEHWARRLPQDTKDILILISLTVIKERAKKGKHAPIVSEDSSPLANLFARTFLESECLEKLNFEWGLDKVCTYAVATLRLLLPGTPHEHLAEAVLQPVLDYQVELQSEANSGLLIQLLNLVRDGNEPQRAIPYVLTILDQPTLSASHRHILTSGFLRRIGYEQSKGLFDGFKKTILTRLAQMAERKAERERKKLETGEDVVPDEGDSQPYVKVTTIKLAFEVLGSGRFWTIDDRLKTMIDLSTASNHSDVQDAYIRELFNNILPRLDSLSPERKEELWATLDGLAVIAGRNDESTLISVAQWEELAASSGSSAIEFAQSPQWEAGLNRSLCSNLVYKDPDQLPHDSRSRYAEVIVKIFDEANRNYELRINTLAGRFQPIRKALEEISTKLGNDVKPPSFITEKAIFVIHRWRKYLPSTFFKHLESYAFSFLTQKILQPAWDKVVSENSENPKWTQSPLHRSWKIYSNTYLRGKHPWTSLIREILEIAREKKSDIGVSPLQDLFVRVSRHTMERSVPFSSQEYIQGTSALLSALKPNPLEGPRWVEHVRPLVQLIFDYRNSLSSSQVPCGLLPSPVTYQYYLLPFPNLLPYAKHSDRHESFVQELFHLLGKICESPIYHLDLRQVMDTVREVPLGDSTLPIIQGIVVRTHPTTNPQLPQTVQVAGAEYVLALLKANSQSSRNEEARRWLGEVSQGWKVHKLLEIQRFGFQLEDPVSGVTEFGLFD